MRNLPKVNSLEEAVQTVIRENKKDRYNPTYFTRVITNAENLVQVCSSMIKSKTSYSALTEAFWNQPDLLILEDFVALRGARWGFSDDVVQEAIRRVETFNEFVKHKRYG